MNVTADNGPAKIIYWHHELPPLIAEVIGEVIDARRDEAKGEAWLQGCFTYMLYTRSGDGIQPH